MVRIWKKQIILYRTHIGNSARQVRGATAEAGGYINLCELITEDK